MAAVGGDLPRRVTVASATQAAPAIDNAAYLSSFPESRAVTPVAATSQTASAQPEPIFRSLFQAGERTQPISPAVQELWGKGSSLTSVASATTPSLSAQKPEVRAPGRLDLFSDRNGTFSS
jgi:predicted component of type VI protein secretion system